jgi:2-polyprenyl-3-methyl-5-hydroxy-6-metoxy-1,4-benzoquinol methylase
MRRKNFLDDYQIKTTEDSVKEVYNFCPPTKIHYSVNKGKEKYKKQWGTFLTMLGMKPENFSGLRVLDVGCGSCEKTSFYYDWGAEVTGLDMTPQVLSLAKTVIGERHIELIQNSIFYFQSETKFDLIISDGVLHHTADTFATLKTTLVHLKINGIIIFSLVNTYGHFWWFRYARLLTRMLGGSDFHQRVRWGKRLFRWVRHKEEGTENTSQVFRSEDSWAYDWFGNPRWNLHSPVKVRKWLFQLGLEHHKSIPSIISKENPRNRIAGLFRRIFGNGMCMLNCYWLINREPNMMYICAVKRKEIENSG